MLNQSTFVLFPQKEQVLCLVCLGDQSPRRAAFHDKLRPPQFCALLISAMRGWTWDSRAVGKSSLVLESACSPNQRQAPNWDLPARHVRIKLGSSRQLGSQSLPDSYFFGAVKDTLQAFKMTSSSPLETLPAKIN